MKNKYIFQFYEESELNELIRKIDTVNPNVKFVGFKFFYEHKKYWLEIKMVKDNHHSKTIFGLIGQIDLNKDFSSHFDGIIFSIKSFIHDLDNGTVDKSSLQK